MKEGERSPLFFKFLDLFMVGAFHASRGVVQLMPPGMAYALAESTALAALAARPGARRRLIAVIREALPEVCDGREAWRIALGATSMFFKPIPMFFLYGKHKQRYLENLVVEGKHNLEEAETRGKGVLILYTHLGAFSLLVQVMANIGLKFTPITYTAESTPMPRYLRAMQWYGASLGCDPEAPAIFAGNDASRQVREHLAKAGRVGITVDAPGSSVVGFFGHPAGLGSGIAHFSRDTGAPIVPVALFDTAGGFSRRLVFYPPIYGEATGDKDGDIAAIMQKAAAAGERQIREEPRQWLSWYGLRGMWERGEKKKGGSAEA